MIRYAIQSEGEIKVAVAIIGDDMEEITQHYWGFWNYGATSGSDIIWSNDVVKPYLGYFWTNKVKLKAAVELAAATVSNRAKRVVVSRLVTRYDMESPDL